MSGLLARALSPGSGGLYQQMRYQILKCFAVQTWGRVLARVHEFLLFIRVQAACVSVFVFGAIRIPSRPILRRHLFRPGAGTV